MKIFGREPALWLEFIKALVLLLAVTVLPWGVDEQQAAIVVVTGLFGLLTAVTTRPWQVAGFTEAIKTVAVGLAVFGYDMGPEKLAALVMGVGALITLLERGQVVPAETPVSSP